MNWNEMKKKALENGFEFLKHGSRHDLYINKKKQAKSSNWNAIGHRKSDRV